jgi:hypothetical protein
MIILGTCLRITVFRELRVRHGLQTRVVVLAVHSNYYSRWYITSVVVHQVLGHRNYRLAEDHLGPYVFVVVPSNADLQTLLSCCYEFHGAEVFLIVSVILQSV